mmetsp:Transcript_22892/g.41991  ORF Transcript_22892/g.41991 Transcript_22892/m.41991 type:complete len:119 (-) Transcript_22892:2403-2759(-)
MTTFGVGMMLRSMNRKAISPRRHMTQRNLLLKPARGTTIARLRLANHTSTLNGLRRVVSLSFFCCYEFHSFRDHFCSGLAIWSAGNRTFVLTGMITAMFYEAIFAPHCANAAYAIETS